MNETYTHIIDRETCTNGLSERMVKNLSLFIMLNLISYNDQVKKVRLMWTNKYLYIFSLVKFYDKVLYDIVFTKSSHLLLERPYQYDRMSYIMVLSIRTL